MRVIVFTIAIIAAAASVPAPAGAQERRSSFSVDEERLSAALLAIGRMTGASIGLRDQSISDLRIRRVRGANSAAEALRKALAGTGARARMIAPNTFLVERDPTPPPARFERRNEPPPPTVSSDEIVVTATKLDTPITQYPGAVTVISGPSLSLAQAAHGTDAIAARAPSLTTTHLGPGRNKLFIRGIADSSFTGPTPGTVGQYWGDTRISYSAPDPNLRLYDIGSVEILEGPQGTLYGAGALGGIVKITPNPPNLADAAAGVWGGAQTVSHGSHGGDVGGMINLPVSQDRLGLRLVAYAGLDGGYIDDSRRGLEDINEVRTFGGRAMMRWLPASDWTVDLNVTAQRIRGRDAQYADAGGDRLTRAGAIAEPFSDLFLLGELVITGTVGEAELVSATGLVDQRVRETFDATTGPAVVGYRQNYRVRMLSSETRLARRGDDGVNWVVGVSALDSSTVFDRTLIASNLPFVPVTFGVRNAVNELTLFGEMSTEVMDGVHISGGGRVTQTWRTGNEQNSRAGIDFTPGPRFTVGRFRALPSFAVAVKSGPELNLFMRLQQSYRPGGFALRGEAVDDFTGDRLTALEAGLRYNGARFSTTVTLAGTRWTDIQADIVGPNGFPFTANIGNGRILSAGLTASWRPMTRLELESALYLNTSKVTRAAPGTDIVESRGPLPNVADVTGRVAISYTAIVGDGWRFEIGTSARYVGRSRLGVGPRLGKLQGDYLDTTFETRLQVGRYGLAVSMANLLDMHGSRFALGSPFLLSERDHIVPMQPRTLRAGFDISF